jgi:hypothetical protein
MWVNIYAYVEKSANIIEVAKNVFCQYVAYVYPLVQKLLDSKHLIIEFSVYKAKLLIGRYPVKLDTVGKITPIVHRT